MAIAEASSTIADWPTEGCSLSEAYQRMPSFAQGVRPDGVTAELARRGLRLDIAFQTIKSFCEKELRPYLESGELVLVDGQSEEPIRASLIRYLQFDPDAGIVRGPNGVTIRYAVRVHAAGTWKPKRKEPLPVKVVDPIEIIDKRKRNQKKTVTPVGAPPRYDNPAIVGTAKDVITRGIPDTQELFFEKVRDECDERHIRTHKSETRFAEVVGPIYKRAKQSKSYRPR